MLAGQSPHRRYSKLTSIVLVALPFLIFTPVGFPFGNAGHPGISRWTFDLLQAKNSVGQPISRFPYYRDQFYQTLATASMIPDNLPPNMILFQSAEHYYDPTYTAWLFPVTWTWLGNTYEVVDGSGYNGLSGFLFYLVGGSPLDNGNPTAGTSRVGALQTLRDIFSFAGGQIPSDANEKVFTKLLGSAFHYFQDIHSPGHTDWTSATSYEGYLIYPFRTSNWHVKFDYTGDAYFQPRDTITDANFDGYREVFLGYYDELHKQLHDKETLPILIYRYNEYPVHDYQPERNEPVPLDSDLSQFFNEAAVFYQEDVWDHFKSQVIFKGPDATFPVFCTSLEDSLELAARRCAGVVDWTFTAAVEGENEIAERDAPNFLGIARAMASKHALDIVKVPNIEGALWGPDQDDFYPLKIPLGAWSFRFQTEGAAGLTMALYNEEGFTIAEGLDLPYSGSGVVYLRVFSMPQSPDRLLDCEYTVVVSNQGSEPLPGELLGRNLIANGDAEQGEPSLWGEMVPVPCWTVTEGFTVVAYDPDSFWFPGVDCPGPEDRGRNLFFGGSSTAESAAGQTVDVSALQILIDQGRISYALSGYLGGWEDQDDAAVLTVSFLDGSAKSLGAGSIGPVSFVNRSYVTGLQQRRIEGRVPAGTRKLDILLEMFRGEGWWNFDNDGYADNLTLYLHVSDANSVP